jgi:hypothetical protein
LASSSGGSSSKKNLTVTANQQVAYRGGQQQEMLMIPTLQINAINAKSNQNMIGSGSGNQLIVSQTSNTARSLPEDQNNKRISNFIVVGETGGLES